MNFDLPYAVLADAAVFDHTLADAIAEAQRAHANLGALLGEAMVVRQDVEQARAQCSLGGTISG